MLGNRVGHSERSGSKGVFSGRTPHRVGDHPQAPSMMGKATTCTAQRLPGKGLAVSSEQRIGGSARVAFYLRPAQRALRPLIIEESS